MALPKISNSAPKMRILLEHTDESLSFLSFRVGGAVNLIMIMTKSDLPNNGVTFVTSHKEDTIQRRKKRGKDAELELVHLLERYGYAARRAAASGVGGWVSDVEAYNEATFLAIECKSSRRGYAIIPKHQLEKIRQALHYARIMPFDRIGICAVKFPKLIPPWTFYKLSSEDYAKEYIKVRRGQASNWIPNRETYNADTDPFSLEGAPPNMTLKIGRPRQGISTVACPKCHRPAHRPTVTRTGPYEYYRYFHAKGDICKSKICVSN